MSVPVRCLIAINRRLTYKNVKAAIYKRKDMIEDYPTEVSELSESVQINGEGLYRTQYKILTDMERPLLPSDKGNDDT